MLEKRNKDVNGLDLSFLNRMRLLANGLHQKSGSLAYKLALIELERLSAPISALLIPLLTLLILLLTANRRNARDENVNVQILTAPDPVLKLEQEEISPPPEVNPDFQVDVEVNIPSVEVNTPSPPQPATPKVNQLPQNTVLNIKSPIILRSIFGREVIGGSGSVGLGSDAQVAGDLVGVLYDLKRNRKGAPRKWNYFADVKNIVLGDLNRKAFSPYYQVGKKVYLSHLFVPQAGADLAPKIFKVDGLMEPKGWIAHYTGKLQPKKSGTYRFIGQFDDYLCVLVDRKVVLEATYTSCLKGQKQIVSGWVPKDNLWQYRAQQNSQYLTFGDWVKLDSKKVRQIDILCGENPGGLVGGILLIEEQGIKYQKTAAGQPILPPFVSGRLSYAERKRLSDSKFPFETSQIPMMNTQGQKDYSLSTIDKDDLSVDIGNL